MAPQQPVSVQFNRSEMAAVRRASDDDLRSIENQVRSVVRMWLIQNGYLQPRPVEAAQLDNGDD